MSKPATADVRLLVKRIWLTAALAVAAVPATGQSWGIGASLGGVNDITARFRLDEFRSRDIQGWAQYQLEENVVLRAAFGALKWKGVNAGTSATISGSAVVLPDLSNNVDYVNLGASYDFWEGDYTSGLFAGIGGYRIRPQEVTAPLESFRDQRETVFGWHVGADASVRIISRLSVVGRLTYHNVRATVTRQILTANAGVLWKF